MEIKKTFKKVKGEIVCFLEEEQKKIIQKDKMNRIDMLLKRQFFQDIFYGAIGSEEDLEKRKKLINLNINHYSHDCLVFKIFTDKDLKENVNILEIRNFIDSSNIQNKNDDDEFVDFYHLHLGHNNIVYVSISPTKKMNFEKIESTVYKHFDEIIQQINALFNIKMKFETIAVYHNLYDLIKEIDDTENYRNQSSRSINDSMEMLNSRINQIILNVRSEEYILAKNLIEKIFNQTGNNLQLIKYICEGIVLEIVKNQFE